MILYAPSYYKEFACIKGECRHSCCRGWDIGVDSSTLDRLEGKSEPLLLELKERIVNDGEGAYIERCESGDCPFLDEGGLCRIISALGDKCIPEICREHPRFYNILGDRVEVGLGAACEEAARIILSVNGFYPLLKVGETDGEACESPCGYALRERILSSLKDGVGYNDIKATLIRELSLNGAVCDATLLYPIFEGLEYADGTERELILSSLGSSGVHFEEYSVRFFAYLVFRYLSVADTEAEIRSCVAMAIILTDLLDGVADRLGAARASFVEAARILSSELEYSTENIEALLFEIEFLLI